MRNAAEEMVIPYDLTFRIQVAGEEYTEPVEGAYVTVNWKWYSYLLGRVIDEVPLYYSVTDRLGFIEPRVISDFSTTWYGVYWISVWVHSSYGTLYFPNIPMKGICISACVTIYPSGYGCLSVNYGNGEEFDNVQGFR